MKMKGGKYMTKILLKIVAIITLLSVACISLSGCEKDSFNISKYYSPSNSSLDESWYTVDEENVVLENASIKFILDSKSTHFEVTNKKDGKIYTSVPKGKIDTFSEETQYRLNSEITVRYYEQQSDAMYLYSGLDSVENQSFEVLTNGEAIRVNYNIGEQQTFVPEVFDEDSYEKLMERLGSPALERRFERYYIYYSKAEKIENFDEQKEKYPILSEEPLYILDEMVSDIDRADISSYLLDAGYTVEEYSQMLDTLKINNNNTNESAGYFIPVQYSLTEDGFSAEILSDLITENSDKYKLQAIDFLEYFAASSGKDGSFLVPDGSGAVIEFNSNGGDFQARYYGDDFSLREEETKVGYKTLSLPIFAETLIDGGFFATIKSGAEVATLNTQTISDSSPMNHIFTSFSLRAVESTDYGSKMSIPIYNLFSKDLVKTVIKVEYTLLDKESNSYIDMAKYYRNTLIDDGVLSETVVNSSPIFVDYLCMVTEETSMMGVPYTKKIVLSTISEIKESVEKMISADIGPLVVRLMGYGSDGYEHKAYTKFKLDKRVGTVKELIELKNLIQKNGGQLFLDADMQFAYKNGNGFLTKNSSRYLNRLVVCRGDHDLVKAEYNQGELLRYLISPRLYPDFVQKMNKSLNKTFKDALPGISYGTVGLMFGSDFTNKKSVDRIQALSLIDNALNCSNKYGFDMLFDNGNYYTLKYADLITNVPLKSSGYELISYDVPFYQMVVHGCIPYAATPQNLSIDNTEAKLSAVALGAAPYYAFITKEDSLISNTPYEHRWFSLHDDGRLDDLIEYAKQTRQIRDLVSLEPLVDYQLINDSLSVSTYGDNTKLYVNYGKTAQKIGDVVIEANSFKIGG